MCPKSGSACYRTMARPKADAVDRMAGKFLVGAGCWPWTAGLTDDGYGQIRNPGGSQLAHKVLYEALYGPVPEGLELDHVAARGCTTKACVNPGHLEPVPHLENVRRWYVP